jgi:hypothetical protein
VVRPLRPQPDAGAIVEPEPGPFRLLLRHLQPLAPPDPLDPLVVHPPAGLTQQRRDAAIIVPAVLTRQLDDVSGQALFVGPTLRDLALDRAVLPERAAGAALRHARRLPRADDAEPTTRGAQKFPFAAS